MKTNKEFRIAVYNLVSARNKWLDSKESGNPEEYEISLEDYDDAVLYLLDLVIKQI